MRKIKMRQDAKGLLDLSARAVGMGDAMSQRVPTRSAANIRRGHFIRGMRDIGHIEPKPWEQQVATMQRMGEQQHFNTVNAFYSTLARVGVLLESVREREQELQASNEEMEATNEELQATSEEMEATNEEMEASNEELKATTDELERTNVYNKALMNSMLDILMTTDPEGVITEVNDATERISGYTRQELIRQPFRKFFTDPERAQAGIDEVITQNEVSNYELMVVTKDGRQIPVSYNATVVRDSKGKITGVVGSARNMSVFKKAEKQKAETMNELGRSNAELEQFAYISSHDLQEPLRMVSSYTELLSRRYKGKLDADADEFIAYARDGAIRMQKMINDLLTYSRVSAIKSEFKPIDCEDVLESGLTNLKAAIEESDVAVTHDPLPTVMGTRSQFVQLFQNLIGNAIKFRAEKGPCIHISAQQKGNEWVFSVKDNGIGIQSEHKERIFVVFQRLHDKEDYPGTGIGLSICKKIVEGHGGRIWIESEPGKGSTFYFTIPTRGDE